jgi:hypothetical protein
MSNEIITKIYIKLPSQQKHHENKIHYYFYYFNTLKKLSNYLNPEQKIKKRETKTIL